MVSTSSSFSRIGCFTIGASGTRARNTLDIARLGEGWVLTLPSLKAFCGMKIWIPFAQISAR